MATDETITVNLTYFQATRLMQMAQAKLDRLREFDDFTPSIAELQAAVGNLKSACRGHILRKRRERRRIPADPQPVLLSRHE